MRFRYSAVTECGVTSAQLQEFRHEALLYAGDDGFLQGTVPFIQEGISLGEVVLVVVDARKIALLSVELDGAAKDVVFADMAEVGRNPARIIPVWREFVRLGKVGSPMPRAPRPAAIPRAPELGLDQRPARAM